MRIICAKGEAVSPVVVGDERGVGWWWKVVTGDVGMWWYQVGSAGGVVVVSGWLGELRRGEIRVGMVELRRERGGWVE